MADSLQALSELLSPQTDVGEDDDPEDGWGPRGTPQDAAPVGTGEVGPPPRGGSSRGTLCGLGSGDGAIWSAEEVPEEGGDEAEWDPRPQPEYEVVFQQRVGAEDAFLGLGRKDPSSACCEGLLVKVRLPGTRAADISLDVREKVLDLRTPEKKLFLHLPHPVDTKSGRALFLAEKGVLEVTLRMQREFDFINFA